MTRKGTSKYTEEEIQTWIASYNRTSSADKTALEFGVPWGSIYHQLKSRGMIKSTALGEHFKHSVEDVAKWASFYEAGNSAQATARHFGIEGSVVRSRLKKLGIYKHSTSKPRVRSKHTPEKITEYAADYLLTGSTRKTGERFGVPSSHLVRLLKPLGIVPDLFHSEEEKAANKVRNSNEKYAALRADPDAFLAVSLKKHHGDRISLEQYLEMDRQQENLLRNLRQQT